MKTAAFAFILVNLWCSTILCHAGATGKASTQENPVSDTNADESGYLQDQPTQQQLNFPGFPGQFPQTAQQLNPFFSAANSPGSVSNQGYPGNSIPGYPSPAAPIEYPQASFGTAPSSGLTGLTQGYPTASGLPQFSSGQSVSLPQNLPSQPFSTQQFPSQQFPSQPFSPQSFPSIAAQPYNLQGFDAQQLPSQSFAPQGFPSQPQQMTILPPAVPTGGFSPGSFPSVGFPTGGFPSGGMPYGGFPSEGIPSGGFPSGGFPSGGFPSGGFPSGGFPSVSLPSPCSNPCPSPCGHYPAISPCPYTG